VDADNHFHLAFVTTLDVQVLLGIALYYPISPLIRTFMEDPAASMGMPQIRFFAVEHATMMVVALVLAHIGRAVSRKKEAGAKRHQAVFFNVCVVLLIVAAAIPWPFVPAARPLFRVENVTISRLEVIDQCVLLPELVPAASNPR
jgi:uncharacterized membrane protein required for colicin V production